MKTVIEQLYDFIQRSRNRFIGCNEWLEDDHMKVYVRKSLRSLGPDVRLPMLDIANVGVFKQGKGTFKRFLAEAELLNPWFFTFIENVQTAQFANYFQREGWLRYYSPGALDIAPPCFSGRLRKQLIFKSKKECL